MQIKSYQKLASATNNPFRNAFANTILILSGLPDLPTLVHIGFITWSQITLSSISTEVAPYHPSTEWGVLLAMESLKVTKIPRWSEIAREGRWCYKNIGLMQNKVDDRYMESLCDYRVSGFSA